MTVNIGIVGIIMKHKEHGRAMSDSNKFNKNCKGQSKGKNAK